MEGTGSDRGVISRAVEQVFSTAGSLKSKGWSYSFTASFLEIYNEQVRDLLAAPGANSKPEIRHARGSGAITVTDCV